jgi:23S rRNA pseudouridine2605 synthase
MAKSSPNSRNTRKDSRGSFEDKGKGGHRGTNREDAPYKKRAGSSDKPFGERKGRGSDANDRDKKPYGDKPKRTFGGRDDEKPFKERSKRSFDSKEGGKPYEKDNKRPFTPRGEEKPFKERSKRSFDSNEGDKPFRKDSKRPFTPRGEEKPFKERGKRSFDSNEGDKPFRKDSKRPFTPRGEDKPFKERSKRSFDSNEGDKPFRKDSKRPFTPREDDKPFKERSKRSFDNKEGDRPYKKDGKRSFDKQEDRPRSGSHTGEERTDSRPFRERNKSAAPGKPRSDRDEKPRERKGFEINTREPRKKKEILNEIFEDRVEAELEDAPKKKFAYKEKEDKKAFHKPETEGEEEMPLNKYIAHSGECSRRDAAELVRQGKAKVNGELVLDPGYKVQPTDEVTLGGKKLKPTKNLVYILINKPKGFITTNEDPQGRKTVMELVANSGIDRLFAIGRLDRNTTGLLLLTNDGDLAQKLSHPSYDIKKVYQVTTDKPVTKADFEKIIAGVELEDGIAKVDALAFLESKNELGLEIHSGRNRIVRRIFESLGYEVEKLDRVMYAGLTKKNLPRSKWRFLDEREIVLLKHFKSH